MEYFFHASGRRILKLSYLCFESNFSLVNLVIYTKIHGIYQKVLSYANKKFDLLGIETL